VQSVHTPEADPKQRTVTPAKQCQSNPRPDQISGLSQIGRPSLEQVKSHGKVQSKAKLTERSNQVQSKSGPNQVESNPSQV